MALEFADDTHVIRSHSILSVLNIWLGPHQNHFMGRRLESSSPLKGSPRERRSAIFLLEQPWITIWYVHQLVFENTLSQGKDVRFLVTDFSHYSTPL